MARAKKKTDEIVVEMDGGMIERRLTGLWSFDRALGGGLPLRSFMELSGWEGSGKSTLAYYLLGVPDESGTIGINDNEGFDPQYAARAAAQSGWRGKIKVIPYVDSKGKPLSEEQMLDALADYLLMDEVSAVLLDSIGGVSPIGEEEGSVADANMGKRAQIVGRFLRRAVHRMRRAATPKVLIATNHIHQIMSGQGTITSGGKAVHYLAATRIRISRTEEDGWWLLQGKIVKRRYHGTDPISTFQAVLIPGEGIHPGLTAVQDCILMGLAEKTNTVRMNDKSYGYFKSMVQNRSDSEQFEPFRKALQDATPK